MNQNTVRQHPLSGFTLIELLGVISILLVLVALMIPILQQVRIRSRTAQAKAGIAKIESALNLYKMDYGMVPTAQVTGLIMTSAGLYTILSAPASNPLRSLTSMEPYLKVPAAQINTTTRQFLDPWRNPYWIRPSPTNNSGFFDVYSAGPDGTKDTPDDVTNWSRQ